LLLVNELIFILHLSLYHQYRYILWFLLKLLFIYLLVTNLRSCDSEETELQCVPGRFESVEEYVRVFEPLLFEECRAQLYSTWEESTETVSRDTHIMVRVKANESRERGTSCNFQCLFCVRYIFYIFCSAVSLL